MPKGRKKKFKAKQQNESNCQIQSEFNQELAGIKQECEPVNEEIRFFESESISEMSDDSTSESDFSEEMPVEFGVLMSPMPYPFLNWEKVNEGNNFLQETAMGILYNYPIVRECVLHQTEPDQRDGYLKVIYDVFSNMSHFPYLLVSEKLLKLCRRKKHTLQDYLDLFLLEVASKVPQVPTGALDEMSGSVKESTLASIDRRRSKLKDACQFQWITPCKCKCGTRVMREEHIAIDSDGSLTDAVNKISMNAVTECPDCKTLYTADGETTVGDIPEHASFIVKQWQYSDFCTLNGHKYSFKAAALYNIETEKYSFIMRRKNVFWMIRQEGATMYNRNDICEIFGNRSMYEVKLVTFKRVSFPVDQATLTVLKGLTDPPARFRNTWGDCMFATLSNAFLCMPVDIRRKLKELEVPRGEQPSPWSIAPLWELIDGAEKVVAKQKKIQWNRMRYPDRIIARLMLLDIMNIHPANKGRRCRIFESGGASDAGTIEALLKYHSKTNAFKRFASYTYVKEGDQLTKDHLETNALNIVVYGGRLKNIWTINDILLKRPEKSLLIMCVMKPYHIYLAVVRPQDDVIAVNDGVIKCFPSITDDIRSLEACIVMCLPDVTQQSLSE